MAYTTLVCSYVLCLPDTCIIISRDTVTILAMDAASVTYTMDSGYCITFSSQQKCSLSDWIYILHSGAS